MVSHPFLAEVECSDESFFSEGGGPPAEPRGGGVPVCNQHQEEGRGDRDESPFSRRGWGGTVMSYPLLGEGGGVNTLLLSTLCLHFSSFYLTGKRSETPILF